MSVFLSQSSPDEASVSPPDYPASLISRSPSQTIYYFYTVRSSRPADSGDEKTINISKEIFFSPDDFMGKGKRAYTPASFGQIISRVSVVQLGIKGQIDAPGELIIKENFETSLSGTSPESIELIDRSLDHLERRVQLFYLLALSVFKKFSVPGTHLREPRGMTCFQGGLGRKLGNTELQGAHSSVITRLEVGFSKEYLTIDGMAPKKLTPLQVNKDDLFAKMKLLGWSEKQCAALFDIISTTNSFSRTSDDGISKACPGIGMIPFGSDAHQFLSSTVLLPDYINSLDNYVEAKCREDALKLLNNCFKGLATPAEVTEDFARRLKGTLLELQNKYSKIDTLVESVMKNLLSITMLLNIKEQKNPKILLQATKKFHLEFLSLMGFYKEAASSKSFKFLEDPMTHYSKVIQEIFGDDLNLSDTEISQLDDSAAVELLEKFLKREAGTEVRKLGTGSRIKETFTKTVSFSKDIKKLLTLYVDNLDDLWVKRLLTNLTSKYVDDQLLPLSEDELILSQKAVLENRHQVLLHKGAHVPHEGVELHETFPEVYAIPDAPPESKIYYKVTKREKISEEDTGFSLSLSKNADRTDRRLIERLGRILSLNGFDSKEIGYRFEGSFTL